MPSAPEGLAARLADTFLEASIVGSFTKAGIRARASLFDWEALPSMAGKSVLITGGSSGIGRAAALAMMRLGAHVIVTSRSLERAEAAANQLSEEAGLGSALGLAVDTGTASSVRSLADAVMSATEKLDVLANNAGALSGEFQTDDDGVELTLSSHLIGPYLLTKLLKGHMSEGARVLWMSSGGMYTQGLNVERLESSEGEYKGAVAYAKAKRAQVELVHLLGPRWAPAVSMYSMHPGWVATPGVDAGIPGFGKVMGPTLRTPAEGADTLVWLAATAEIDAAPGSFFHDRRPRRTSYLPGQEASPAERQKLLNWLDEMTETG